MALIRYVNGSKKTAKMIRTEQIHLKPETNLLAFYHLPKNLWNEAIEHYGAYVGRMIKRGLFRSARGMLINLDVNGAYNIMKKAILKVCTK